MATSTVTELCCPKCGRVLREYPRRWGIAVVTALASRADWKRGELERCRRQICGAWLEILYPVLA